MGHLILVYGEHLSALKVRSDKENLLIDHRIDNLSASDISFDLCSL